MKSFADLYDDKEVQRKAPRRYSSFADLYDFSEPQAEPEESGGGFSDTVKNLSNFTPAGIMHNIIDSPVPHLLGALVTETAGNVAKGLGENFGEDTWRRRALDTASDLAQNVTNAALQTAQNQLEVGDDNTFTGAIGNRYVSSGSGLIGNAASMLHADTTADAAAKASEATANKNRVSTDDLGEYFTDPRGFASDATEQLVSTAMIAPFMGLLPEAVAARGVAALGGDALVQALTNRGMYGLAKFIAGGAPQAIRYGFTSAPAEEAMEGGETRRELLNRGASEEEATRESLITMGKNIPLLMVTNTLEGLTFFSPLRGANKALQIAGRGAVNSAQEQYEEFAQQGIQNEALGEPHGWLPWNGAPNQYEAAERVRYPAALLGGAGGAIQAFAGRDEEQENWRSGSQENISNEDYSSRANLSAKQAEIWDAAQYASARAKEKFGYDIAPELIYKQWGHEAGPNFDSENARYNNNFGGLTQTEPNGEENKQPDGNNYYRHFNNVREYADTYVDDFIRYYPEISGAKNEREFAGVLKSYGYFSDDLENYVAGMEGIQAPTSRTNGISYLGENGGGEGKYWIRNPNMNVSTEGMRPESLNALDILGKYFFDNTGKPLILNAGTNGDHAAGEFSHANGWKFDIIDQLDGDGALITADYGRGQFLDRFVKFGRSLGLGMNFEGEGTSNVHLDVAVDGTQWDGNGDHAGGFNLDKVRATAAPEARSEQPSQEQSQQEQPKQKGTQEDEPTKPLFDLNSEDSTTQNLLEQFLNQRFDKAIADNNVDEVEFVGNMFDDNSVFQNTQANREALAQRYGDDLNAFFRENSREQAQPDSQSKPPEAKGKTKQEKPFDRDAAIIGKGREFLDELMKKADATGKENAWKLNSAIQNNDIAAVEDILKQNNVTIPEPAPTQAQPSQDSVKGNTSPENVLSQPNKNTTGQDKLIKRASQTVTPKTSHDKKQKIGNAVIQLANQNGIAVPAVDFKSLRNGSSKKAAPSSP